MGIVGELVSIGTLFAFVIVCAASWSSAIPSDIPSVQDPARPFVLLWASCRALLMSGLPWDTWMRLLAWMALGLIIYFTYGIRKSKLRRKP